MFLILIKKTENAVWIFFKENLIVYEQTDKNIYKINTVLEHFTENIHAYFFIAFCDIWYQILSADTRDIISIIDPFTLILYKIKEIQL